MLEAEPDPPLAQERVRLHRHRQVGKGLVASDVQGAQGDPPTGHGFGDRAVDTLLLRDVGSRPPVEEQELGAHEAGTVRSRRERRPGVGHRAEVGCHDERDPVAGGGGSFGHGELTTALFGDLYGAPSVLLEHLRRRIDVHLTATTVEEHDRAVGDAQDVGSRRDHHRDVAGPGQDGGVRRRAPLGEHHSGDQAEIQAGRLRRREVARDEDALARHLPRGPADQRLQHLVTDRVHVRGPFAEVGVGQLRPLALQLGEAACPGCSGAGAGADAGLHIGQHLRVGEQRQVRVEDARLFGAHLSRGEDPDPLDLAAHGRHGLDDAAPLRSRLARRLLVDRDRHGPQPARRPDGDSRRSR